MQVDDLDGAQNVSRSGSVQYPGLNAPHKVELSMLKTVVFIFLAPVITGLLVLAVAIRETAGPLNESAQMILLAVAAGIVISIPATLFVAKQISKVTENKTAG
jgi:ABC-type phosphate/phosphonate transport system permease subunit